jgi:riboflavin synthase
MFTGIVQGKAKILELIHKDQFMTLRAEFPPEHAHNVQTGASIALNGTCLTVTQFESNQIQFDLIQETLAVTNLGDLKVGDVVNFERAAKFGDEIGGHLISGHISDMATLIERVETENNCVLWFQVDPKWLQYILPKGFIGLNGCSLTIGEVIENRFNAYLIPETLSITTFGDLSVGDKINLEVDPHTQAVVDTVNRYLTTHTPLKA